MLHSTVAADCDHSQTALDETNGQWIPPHSVPKWDTRKQKLKTCIKKSLGSSICSQRKAANKVALGHFLPEWWGSQTAAATASSNSANAKPNDLATWSRSTEEAHGCTHSVDQVPPVSA